MAICFCAVPFFLYWLVGWLVGFRRKFLDSGSQPSINGSPTNLHTSLVTVKPGNLPVNFFLPHPRETSNFAELLPTCRQSEACNFSMAQHINKQKTDVSSTINVLKTMYQTWGVQ